MNWELQGQSTQSERSKCGHRQLQAVPVRRLHCDARQRKPAAVRQVDEKGVLPEQDVFQHPHCLHFELSYKRLEAGTFQMPLFDGTATSVTLSGDDLHLILSGIDLESVKKRKRFQLYG